jgi:hypothetical protein
MTRANSIRNREGKSAARNRSMAASAERSLADLTGALFFDHPTHEVDCVLRAKLFHDVRTVKFDGTRTDTEQASGFFT